MSTLNKEKLLDLLTKRFAVLEDQVTRDFGGGTQGTIFRYREVKFWKEAVERGEFDSSYLDKIDDNT